MVPACWDTFSWQGEGRGGRAREGAREPLRGKLMRRHSIGETRCTSRRKSQASWTILDVRTQATEVLSFGAAGTDLRRCQEDGCDGCLRHPHSPPPPLLQPLRFDRAPVPNVYRAHDRSRSQVSYTTRWRSAAGCRPSVFLITSVCGVFFRALCSSHEFVKGKIAIFKMISGCSFLYFAFLLI